ncbi:MAG: PhzF family phenazine biosynthesis protein [Planctomycetota bacterium]|nr:PhzF family phenazine biosynthesis protein [Planctomycetota bacterium]
MTQIVQVDAFAERPFTGNPAAVCVTSGPCDEAWMQAVAIEMNLSETAFLHPNGLAEHSFALRWFTPAGEVALCGHATLASAHVLWTEGHLRDDATARFLTASGELTAERSRAGITLDFPATPVEAVAPEPGLVEALGVTPSFVGRSRFDAFVVLEDEASLRALAPDMGQLAGLTTRGVIATSVARDHDFVSRFFAPGLGIPEDPVTGSAHCALGPFWAARLGKLELDAYQASARGGRLGVRVRGERVLLTGRAVTTLRGELLV